MSEETKTSKETDKASQDKQEDTMISIHMEGYEVIEKIVKTSGNTGRVYLPTEWIGSKVKIVRISPLSGDRKKRKRRRL